MKGQCNRRLSGRRKKGMGGSIAAGAAKGALSGLSMSGPLAPWGAAIGGVLGGIGGFFKGKGDQQALEEEKRRLQLETEMQQSTDYISDQMSLQTYNNLYNEKAMGGTIPKGVNEGISAFLQAAQANGSFKALNSSMAKFDGNSHGQGGIGLDANLDGNIETEVEGQEVIEEDRIYSKQFKPNPELLSYFKDEGFNIDRGSYAKIAGKLGKQKKKYEDKLAESVDEAAVNTGQIMLSRIGSLLDTLFYDQEISK